MKLTFLHTSASHIKRFDDIIKNCNTSLEIEHWVSESLLKFAQENGSVDEVGFNATIQEIQDSNGGAIICTCSTYGSLCDASRAIYRIDEPVGVFIVSNYSYVGLAFTLASTKKGSRDLLEGLAVKNNHAIKIIEMDCSSSWPFFEKGSFKQYELEIARQIKENSSEVGVVFLAQASMEGAKKHLDDEQFQVMSSAAFGVKSYLDLFQEESNRL